MLTIKMTVYNKHWHLLSGVIFKPPLCTWGICVISKSTSRIQWPDEFFCQNYNYNNPSSLGTSSRWTHAYKIIILYSFFLVCFLLGAEATGFCRVSFTSYTSVEFFHVFSFSSCFGNLIVPSYRCFQYISVFLNYSYKSSLRLGLQFFINIFLVNIWSIFIYISPISCRITV